MSANVKVNPWKMNYDAVEPGEEVVISGISGRFPESRNVDQLKKNLMDKTDLITSNYERWKLNHAEIPRDGGKVSDLTKFDALFFGVHYKQAHAMDAGCRMLLEHAYEAIVDAGINPRQLRGTNTAVVVGSCISETEKTWYYDKLQANGLGITGCCKAMLSNRISYFFGLHGPSYSMDTACSSSLVALDHAYKMIKDGTCDTAIVGGVNLCLHPHISLQFARLGVLSTDCRCKTFDERANGYVRSEAACVILLQKAKDAKRIYAEVVHTKTNCDGYKEQGITFPASDIQMMLLTDFYKECKISPTCLSYLEAHGTGTSVGDPEELNAIDKVFCQNRKSPLKVGSVKSNLGHTEPTSGLCSVAKVIIAMESGVIPPNLHFNRPMKGIRCFEENKLEVITEPTEWEGGYVGINSFGFGGVNAHVLLKSWNKEKINHGAPKDDLPRVIAVSGRTEEAVDCLLRHVESIPVDVEYIRLLHNIHADDIIGHLYRGYTVVGSKITETPVREIQQYPGIKRPVWFVFSGMGSQWPGMGEGLMRFPVFMRAIQKCDAVLKPLGVDIINIITNKDKKTFDNILNSFVGIAAIQIGLVDLLRCLGIEPDKIIGHSVGELGCAYADGCFTAEQMVLAAYYRGLASIKTKMIRGSMAAIGLGYDEMKNMCPPDIEIACHNGPDSCTISGPAESMKAFVAKLQANKIFAKEVPCSNIAYHSRYIAEAGPVLLAHLKKVIPDPKPRSSKWLSTSVPENKWSTPEAKYSSAEYHTNNLLNSVLFAEVSPMIPPDAITIEIAPHGLLQAILKRSLDQEATNIALTRRGCKDNAEYFLQAIGKLYNVGLQPQLANIYPDVQFPVSRCTPMISPYIKWAHTEDWYVPFYTQKEKITTAERTVTVTLNDEAFEYMSQHVIDGRCLIPATGYLMLVWETVSLLQGLMCEEVSVVFEDIKFERATTLLPEGSVKLIVMVHRGSGKFEISEGSTTVVTGVIRAVTNPEKEMISKEYLPEIKDEEILSRKDIYKELKLRGYEYTGQFRALKSASINGSRGIISWKKNWAAFIDNMLQIKIMTLDTRALYVPTAIKKLVIDMKVHNDYIRDFSEEEIDIPVYVYQDYDVVVSGGIEIRGVKANSIQRRRTNADPVLEEYKFVAHRDREPITLEHMIVLSTQLALESNIITTPKVLELIDHDDNIVPEDVFTPIVVKVLGDLPVIRGKIIFAAVAEKYESLAFPENVTVIEPKKLPEDGSVFLAIGSEILSRQKRSVLDQLLAATLDSGFILLRETIVNKDTLLYLEACGLNVVLEKTCGSQTLLLLKKEQKRPDTTEVVHVKNNEFSWIEKVKELLENEKTKNTHKTVRLVLVAQGDQDNGLLGLAKCLRREPNGDIVKAMLIQDEKAPPFSLDDPFYSHLLDIDIGYNVIRPGKVWGTYRHVPYPPLKPSLVPHAYATLRVKGDLSSFQWVEGPLTPNMDDDSIVKVMYSSINFKDVMLATGKLMEESITTDRFQTDCLLGFEFSGIDRRGRRVMGFVPSKGIANMVRPTNYNLWTVPDAWSLEEAATIPIAYVTAFYAFYVYGKLKKGEKVLIHAGSGGVGQAAINIALSEGCEIFTTVGTPEKRKFIRETYPSIPDDHIGNSRDTCFEQMIMKLTNRKGVDIVLNSLAEEKLQASVRCLAFRGRFLEIGKFDIATNSQLGMELFLREASFHGIMLDRIITGDTHYQIEIYNFLKNRLCNDCVKPLVRTCFGKDQVSEAFKYMASGKHIGKVLIKVAEENEPLDTPVMAYPRFNASKNKTYVLIGGLGGLGLELADWLVLRGARNLVMVSRNGIKDGYQKFRTETWKSYGVNVLVISGKDATKTEDCEYILKAAEKLAPVDAIFNLAALLKDCLMVNQTEESFEESMAPKAKITRQLDQLSRKICPKLRHFVVFSSLSCGRGTPGQANYGMANAVLERICERRVADGYPGMAIQWGAVADVGLAAEMLENKQQLVIGGTLPQRIFSCLEELDKFLCQPRPIVASMVVAEKRAGAKEASNVLEAVMNIMNLKDLKSVGAKSSLSDLGMDSMVAVEIKQTLERDFEVFLSPQDIRGLTIGKLMEMSKKGNKKQKKNVQVVAADSDLNGVKLLIRSMDVGVLDKQYCIDLPVKCTEKKSEVFLIPGIEGSASIFFPLASKLKVSATCLQLGIYDVDSSIESMADRLLPHVLERCKGRRHFSIIGYSYGTLIALELARRLEGLSFVGQLILIDGSPDYMKGLVEQFMGANSEHEYENNILADIMTVARSSSVAECRLELNKCTTWDEKMDIVMKHSPSEIKKAYTLEVRKAIIEFIFSRLQMIKVYNPFSLPPLRTPITLLVPTIPAIQFPDVTYGLDKLTHARVVVHTVDGNHVSMLDNNKIAMVINGEPLDDEKMFKDNLSYSSTTPLEDNTSLDVGIS